MNSKVNQLAAILGATYPPDQPPKPKTAEQLGGGTCGGKGFWGTLSKFG
jgi:hypothetical protein